MVSDDRGQAAQSSTAERGVRDLMALLALSAIWVGKDGATVLRLMLDAVQHLLPVRFALVEAKIESGSEWGVGYIGGTPMSDTDRAAWRLVTQQWAANRMLSLARGVRVTTPLGPLQVVRIELGVGAAAGAAWFGAEASTFPSTTSFAILRAACSLAASGLLAARNQHERAETARLKDEFLAMLGHELRNPLAPIRSASTMLQLEHVSRDQIRKIGVIVERQVRHMTTLVDDLLDVSRMSSGALSLDIALVDMGEVIELACEQVGTSLQAKSHAFTQEISKSDMMVSGDKNRLVQVFANLLGNAARYTPPGGAIALKVSASDTTITIRIEDNGVGIDPVILPRIFDLFVQGQRSSDRAEGGLGVGLALARRIVDLHGGELSACSDGLGAGSTFIVALPRIAHGPAVNAPADLTQASQLRIFIVDDNRDAAEVLGQILASQGHKVWTAHHPDDALARAAAVRPHVFILDIGLPGMDGYELARRLRRLAGLERAELIALTGYGQAQDRLDAYEAGFDHHCVKPVDTSRLQQILLEISHNRHGAQ